MPGHQMAATRSGVTRRDGLDAAIADACNFTLWDVLLRASEVHGASRAVAMAEQELSFRELADASLRAAACLQTRGISQGTCVAYLMHSTPDWIVLHYALMRLGAIAVPISTAYEAPEIIHVLRASHAQHFFFVDHIDGKEIRERIDQIDPGLSTGANASELFPDLRSATMLQVGPTGALVRDASHAEVYGTIGSDRLTPEGPARPDDLAYVVFTSGSTGRPKGASLSNRALSGAARAYAYGHDLRPSDRFLVMLPPFHVTGPLFPALAHCSGASLELLGAFTPERALDSIERSRVTTTNAFQTSIQRLFASPGYRDRDLSSFKKLMVGATASYLDIVQKEFTPESLYTVYGSCEGAGIVTSTMHSEDNTKHGLPLPGVDLKIIDPVTGEECLAGERGEICFKGWSLFKGYIGEGPTPTDENGYFHSGDYGTLDELGELTYLGRYKMMIKSGGENVSEFEVETFLENELDFVEVAAVVGAPDPEWGEVVVAMIQPRDGAQSISIEELRGMCRGRIANFKIPRRLLVLEAADWPMLPNGKVDKASLRERARAEFGAQ